MAPDHRGGPEEFEESIGSARRDGNCRPDFSWVPSNAWVGVGLMKATKVLVAPPTCSAAQSIHPEGDAQS